MLFDQVPTARTHQENSDLRAEAVGLAFRTVEGDRFAHGIDQILLPLHDVFPRRRERIFEVGHENVRAGVEGIDHHLPLDRSGDFHPPLLEVGRSRSDLPVAFANLSGLGKKVGHLA